MAKGCSRAVAVLFTLVFILAFFSGVLFFHLENTLLQPDAYVRALQREGIAEQLKVVASHEIAATLQKDPCSSTPELCATAGGPPAFISGLTAEDWQRILDHLITTDWIRDQAEIVIRAIFSALEGEGPAAPVRADIRSIKAKLEGDSGTEILGILLETLPDCSQSQAAEIGQLLLSGGDVGELLVCSPPEELQEVARPILESQMTELTAELPDEMVLPIGDFTQLFGSEGSNVLERVRQVIRQGLLISAAVATGCILMIMLFAVRSIRQFLLWFGWPILLVGLVLLGLTVTARTSTALLFEFVQRSLEIPSVQAQTIVFGRTLFQAVISSILRGLMVFGFVFSGTGAIMLILFLLFRTARHEQVVGERPDNLY